jgi:hypothetical protein
VGLLAGCLVGESPKGFVCDNGGGKFSFGDNTNKGWDVVCEDKTHGVGKWMVRVRGASRRRWLATYTPPRLFRCFMEVPGDEPLARIVGGIATLSRERG